MFHGADADIVPDYSIVMVIQENQSKQSLLNCGGKGSADRTSASFYFLLHCLLHFCPTGHDAVFTHCDQCCGRLCNQDLFTLYILYSAQSAYSWHLHAKLSAGLGDGGALRSGDSLSLDRGVYVTGAFPDYSCRRRSHYFVISGH